ncbi:crosslink repair DNA glycosylase YcaQ family protein [Cereibacter sp. SYSU M97828]|nr:crosslink repair DNA glycosylase YcaQ family protein [Cereibacter flavus]
MIPNADARRIFLHRHALTRNAPGPLAGLIDRIGFVQLDSINTVERAHHMILSARLPGYRPDHLSRLYASGGLFEHWTHDASVLPIHLFPHWKHRFAAVEQKRDRWPNLSQALLDETLAHIAECGPVMAADMGGNEPKNSGGWWNWHPSKTALEWLWRTGHLSIKGRQGFQKIYDLTERVIPKPWRSATTTPQETLDWACNSALDRLGFATSGEIAAFWRAVTPAEAADWCRAALHRGEIAETRVESADGTLRRHYTRGPLDAPDPPGRIRILSPFDPALRDRSRAERLFGFRYRIEVFVPEAKRQYGYYVFPVMEGANIIGRIDMKRQGSLNIRAFWPEPGIRMGKLRLARLEAELARTASKVGATDLSFAPDWLR